MTGPLPAPAECATALPNAGVPGWSIGGATTTQSIRSPGTTDAVSGPAAASPLPLRRASARSGTPEAPFFVGLILLAGVATRRRRSLVRRIRAGAR